MFANISYIPSSLEDENIELFDPEVLELSQVELKPWLEDEARISKWENLSTWVRTWVRNDKEKKWKKNAPI